MVRKIVAAVIAYLLISAITSIILYLFAENEGFAFFMGWLHGIASALYVIFMFVEMKDD